MPNDESLESQGRQETESISRDALDWGRLFLKHLKLEYADLATGLPANASWQDYREAMMIAVGKVFDESGTTTENTTRLWEEIVGRLLPVDEEAPWSCEKNAQRMMLIDKKIQRSITPEEAIELTRLTQQMRVHCDREEMVPLEGARELHRRLLDMDGVKGTSR